ncbi:MAG: methyl-accepting chemotaxis protein, partial [Oscillospiraceae bacterium]|nr:methyl-accepting chemotaxis protein [Oscillospiraceae bacterium]
MKWFANMKVRAKMILSFMLIVALMAITVVIAVTSLGAVSEDYTVAIDHPITAERIWLHFRSAYRDVRRCLASFSVYMGIDSEHLESTFSDAKKSYDEALRYLDEYESNVKSNPTYGKEDIDLRLQKTANNRALLNQYWNGTVETGIVAARADDHDLFRQIVLDGGQLATNLKDTVDEMILLSEEAADASIETAHDAKDQTTIIMIVIAVIAALIAVVIALYVSGYFSKLLVPMANFLKRAGTVGDIVIDPKDEAIVSGYSQNKDELGSLTAGVAAFVSRITDVSKGLETVADGDLTFDIKPLSSSDVMGNSLQKMVGNLNNMFGEIRNSTMQVNSGSKQIADGSQALAQGSTQQAASVEQLSSSITEIASKTKANADMAGRAAILASTIMQNAEKGSRQMGEMMTAVKDINQASQQISRVIKVIDDIAFQTNILALNAAVEAARAGQHGKGFAVVAEEVRSLASKSAEAAKETGNLIANSTEKAELGSRIAEETSASLTEIVQGINESSQLVSQIAQSSDEQSAGIAQINKGIDQVAQVVQQNSATAEE